MQRAGVSIMANIAEGFARNRPLEFQRYLDMAYASCIEVVSHLYVALDSGAISDAEFKDLRSQAEEVARVVLGLKQSVARAAPPRRTADRGLRTGGGP
jgi:four helix bundle protein